MNTYVVSIGEQAVLAFRAEDGDQAREMIDDHEGDLRSDLQTLVGTDGRDQGRLRQKLFLGLE
jgi:hypothetical protein